MPSTDSNSPAGAAHAAIVISAELPDVALDVLAHGDSLSRSQLAERFPELIIALLKAGDANAQALLAGEALDQDALRSILDRCISLDQCELNATELFNWFTRHEQATLACRLLEIWRDRGLDVTADAVLQALHGLAFSKRLNADSLAGVGSAAAAVTLASSPEPAAANAASLLTAASAQTGYALVDLESQAAGVLNALSSAPDALGFGALTLARQPSVGEPGVSCNRTLINVLCGDCRQRAHHNALDTLRNRLQSGQLRTTEMLDHLLTALKTCGGIRRVHLLEVDLAAGRLRSRRRLHVHGAMAFQPIDFAIGTAPALEAMLLSPQSRSVTPDAVHPDVAALAGSPLLPAMHSVVGSLLVGDRPQALVVVDAEGLPISAHDVQRVHDLIQLGAKLLSLLSPEDGGWHQSNSVLERAPAAANG